MSLGVFLFNSLNTFFFSITHETILKHDPEASLRVYIHGRACCKSDVQFLKDKPVEFELENKKVVSIQYTEEPDGDLIGYFSLESASKVSRVYSIMN